MISALILAVSPTEPAFLHFLVFLELCACLAQVIRFLCTRRAKVLGAFRTPDAKLTHMLGSSLVDHLTQFILHVVVHITCQNLNHISTLALNKVVLTFKCLFSHLRLKFLVSF